MCCGTAAILTAEKRGYRLVVRVRRRPFSGWYGIGEQERKPINLHSAVFAFIVDKVPNIHSMNGSSMARTTPYVEHDLLSGHGGAAPIAVGSPAWFAWLEQARLFAFRSGASGFTARREGRARGGDYWRAYRTIAGRQRRAYLGRAADLTSERLRATAMQLAGDAPEPAAGHAAPPAPTLGASTPLLATKLFLPRVRGARVPRPQLLARLAAGTRLPLTLIAAPAGFGKTTLLADWLTQLSIENEKLRTPIDSDNFQFSMLNSQFNVAWLTLDAADNDPNTFLRYLIAALRRVVPSVGVLALALMEEAQPPPLATLLTTLINDLAEVPQPVRLALDDYHVITSPAVHEALAFLLEHLPPNLHLVIGSREDPPLPLARLRAHGQIAELRAADLRFTPAEVAVFLCDVWALSLDADAIAALEARTEGWVAGLQLAALAMQDREDQADFIAAFTGSNRFVIDYLASEVLDRLPEHMRNFMLRTSVLERMCGPLCDFVTEIENEKLKIEKNATGLPNSQFSILNSQFVLEELEHANLFLNPLDDQRRWYRYHQLLAGVLRERLQRELTGAQVAELHRRASSWFEQAELPSEAIQHALAAGDFARAADLIESSALPIALEGRQATVAGWLAALPETLRHERPRLVLAQAGIDGLNGDFIAATAQLHHAEQLVHGQTTAEASAIHGEIAAMQTMALSMIGDPRAATIGQLALAQLPARHPLYAMTVAGLCYAAFYAGDLAMPSRMLEDSLAARDFEQHPITIRTGMLAMLAMVRRAQGRLEESRRLAEQALALASHAGRVLPLSGALLAYLLLGLAQCERNELDAAEHTLRECAKLAGQYQMAMNEILAQFYLGQVLAARDDPNGALMLVVQAEAAAQRYLSPRNLREIAGYRVLLWLQQGNLSAAAAWGTSYAREVGPDRPRLTAYDYDRFALAQTLVAQGQLEAARDTVQLLLDDAEATGHGRFVIWSLVLLALILDAQGDRTAALASLQRALALAEPHGYLRIIINHGAPIAALLREAHARRIAPAYVERLLAFGELKIENEELKKGIVSPNSQFSILNSQFEPLSAREREVLRLLASGMDNAQIAHTLSVAISTVKAHINHIFGKLGVHNRLEALLRAQKLDLL
jgi:LuxR family transcriptional regulator, maltose regulon positive regulatory protein